MSTPTVSELVRMFLQWASQRMSPNTVKLYRHYLGRFCDLHGERPAGEIKRLDVEMFAVKKHPLEVVRRFFCWAFVNAEAIPANPCKGIEIPKSGRRSRILNPREQATLRRLARPELRRLVLALAETAGRPLELRSVRWEQLHASAGWQVDQAGLEAGACFFSLAKFKSQNRRKGPSPQRTLPISPRLGRMLWRLRRGLRNVTGPVFLSPSGRAWTANALRCSWRRVCERGRRCLGIDVLGLVPYLFRHSKATSLALAGVNGRVLADLLGHSSQELLSWYVHPSTEDLCRIMGYRGLVAGER